MLARGWKLNSNLCNMRIQTEVPVPGYFEFLLQRVKVCLRLKNFKLVRTWNFPTLESSTIKKTTCFSKKILEYKRKLSAELEILKVVRNSSYKFYVKLNNVWLLIYVIRKNVWMKRKEKVHVLQSCNIVRIIPVSHFPSEEIN